MGGHSSSPPPMGPIGSTQGVSNPVHATYSPAPYVDLSPEYLAAVAPYLLDTSPFKGHAPDFAKLQDSIAKNLSATHQGLQNFAASLPTFDRQIIQMPGYTQTQQPQSGFDHIFNPTADCPAPVSGILGDGPITAVYPTAAGNVPYNGGGGSTGK